MKGCSGGRRDNNDDNESENHDKDIEDNDNENNHGRDSEAVRNTAWQINR